MYASKEIRTMPLQEWSPATQVARLERDFQEVLDHFMRNDWGVAKPLAGAHHPLAIESFIETGRLVIRVDLPGIDPADVKVKVEGDILTITASRVARSPEQPRNFVHREIRYGNFERAISIPKGVKEEDIDAAYCNGALELTIPLAQAIEVRKVPVQVAI
jgi:HSP20 family protein